jgi:hypothetical protein
VTGDGHPTSVDNGTQGTRQAWHLERRYTRHADEDPASIRQQRAKEIEPD